MHGFRNPFNRRMRKIDHITKLIVSRTIYFFDILMFIVLEGLGKPANSVDLAEPNGGKKPR